MSGADAQETLSASSLCDIHYPSDDFVEWECRQLKPADTPKRMFGEYWEDVLRFNRLDRRHFIGGLRIKVPKRLEDVEDFSPLPSSYPDAAGDEKFILVDLSEMFLGAYERGQLVDSFPVAAGIDGHPVPTGEFTVDAVDRRHESNMYDLEEVGRPYPMHYGLRFHMERDGDRWPSYWIHGRDLPGFPASHGCIGLYDEEMQRDYYGESDRKAHRKYFHKLVEPFLRGAKELYLWAIGDRRDSGTFHTIKSGPRVLITGFAPYVETELLPVPLDAGQQ